MPLTLSQEIMNCAKQVLGICVLRLHSMYLIQRWGFGRVKCSSNLSVSYQYLNVFLYVYRYVNLYKVSRS